MKSFVTSRLFLTLFAFVVVPAALVVALLSSIVPTYAASSSASLNVEFTSVWCSSPLTLLSLSAGDKVSGTAELKSRTSQTSQSETLLLQETKGHFTQTIPLGAGSQAFSFTAAADNDSLTACITGQSQSDSLAIVSINAPSSAALNIVNRILGTIF